METGKGDGIIMIHNKGRFIFREDGKEWFRCNNVDEAKVFVKVVNEWIKEIQSKI